MTENFIHRNNPVKQPKTDLYTKLSTISTNEKTSAEQKNLGEQERMFCEIRQRSGGRKEKCIRFWKNELSENYLNLKTIELNCCKNESKCVIMFIQ